LVRIQGVLTFPALNLPPDAPPASSYTVSINVSMTQKVGPQHTIEGYTYSVPVSYVSAGSTTPFTLYVTPDEGRFRQGLAQVTISTWLSGQYYHDHYYYPSSWINPSAKALVRLTPVQLIPPQSAPAAQVHHPPRNPVVLNLDPQATGIQITDAAVNKGLPLVRIQGVLTFPALNLPPDALPASSYTVSINVSMTQKVGPRHTIEGYTYSVPVSYVSAGSTTPFTLYVTPSSGRFRQGLAQVTISTYTNAPYYYYYSPSGINPSINAFVRLTPVRLIPPQS
jgi:hypothetical protein